MCAAAQTPSADSRKKMKTNLTKRRYKAEKRSACAMCKPYNRGWEDKKTVRDLRSATKIYGSDGGSGRHYRNRSARSARTVGSNLSVLRTTPLFTLGCAAQRRHEISRYSAAPSIPDHGTPIPENWTGVSGFLSGVGTCSLECIPRLTVAVNSSFSARYAALTSKKIPNSVPIADSSCDSLAAQAQNGRRTAY